MAQSNFGGGGNLNPRAIYQFNINSYLEIRHVGSMAMETLWIIFRTSPQLIWYNSKKIWVEQCFGLKTTKFWHSCHPIFTCVPYSEDEGDVRKARNRTVGERHKRATDKVCKLLSIRRRQCHIRNYFPEFLENIPSCQFCRAEIEESQIKCLKMGPLKTRNCAV